MSQFDFGNLSSPLPGRVLVDDNLEPWRDALHSLHKGDVRPSYAVQGLMWIDDSVNPWLLKIFDGADDIVVGNIDSSSNKFLGVLHPEAITGQPSAVLSATDKLLISDTDDSGALKEVDVQDVLDLVPSTSGGISYATSNTDAIIGAKVAVTSGGDFTLEAGSTVLVEFDEDNLVFNGFNPLSQTSRSWFGMASAPNGDVYACVRNGDIYKQTGGIGNFIALSQTSRDWRGMASTPNGDVYACVNGGDIYKQTGGIGDFNPLSQTSRAWSEIASAPNGDVYACVRNGDIYKQTGGIGNFIALSQTSRDWTGMASAPNGDVYACVNGGDIYKQTGGIGNFIALSQTSRDWRGMASAPNGDVYACSGGDIYKEKELTLKIDDTEPCLIYDEAGNLVTSFNPLYFPAGCVVEFTYDGTSYRFKNKVIESYVNGTDWYRVFTNGWVRQGGWTNSGNYTAINFLKPYKNINYNMTSVVNTTSDTHTDASMPMYNKTTTSFRIHWITVVSAGASWEAFGF